MKCTEIFLWDFILFFYDQKVHAAELRICVQT